MMFVCRLCPIAELMLISQCSRLNYCVELSLYSLMATILYPKAEKITTRNIHGNTWLGIFGVMVGHIISGLQLVKRSGWRYTISNYDIIFTW
jgi:hypothetical protein